MDLEPPGGGPGITLVTWFDEMRPGGLRGLVLAVDDIGEHRRGNSPNGVCTSTSTVRSTISPDGRFASFSDPDGNGWEVLQEPVTSS